MSKIRYDFAARLWQHSATGGWHFVSLPQDLSNETRRHLGHEEEGWGRLKAVAKTGNTQWKTAIWFDTKRQTYLLPVKSEIRKKEQILPNAQIQVTLCL